MKKLEILLNLESFVFSKHSVLSGGGGAMWAKTTPGPVTYIVFRWFSGPTGAEL